jgi:hypothetical protein
LRPGEVEHGNDVATDQRARLRRLHLRRSDHQHDRSGERDDHQHIAMIVAADRVARQLPPILPLNEKGRQIALPPPVVLKE